MIPLSGRITAIADVFAPLTSARPYKKAWPIKDAVELLEKEAGKHFDPSLIHPSLIPLFIQSLPEIRSIKELHSEKCD